MSKRGRPPLPPELPHVGVVLRACKAKWADDRWVMSVRMEAKPSWLVETIKRDYLERKTRAER